MADAGLRYMHRELHPASILSVVANLTPWSDYNQSPRNMYQCQMAKQTMGVPLHSLPHRPDNKLFWLQNPQVPVARTRAYDAYHMEEYPTGTNAVVAVLAYTGYDMEDAMIINKSSMERGFAHASLYKTEWVDLSGPSGRGGGAAAAYIGRGPLDLDARGRYAYAGFLGEDGLAYVGQLLQPGDPFCSEVDAVTRRSKLHRLKARMLMSNGELGRSKVGRLHFFSPPACLLRLFSPSILFFRARTPLWWSRSRCWAAARRCRAPSVRC